MLYDYNGKEIHEEWHPVDPEEQCRTIKENGEPNPEDYCVIIENKTHSTTANVRFRFLRKIFTQVSKLTSYIRKRCAT